MKPLLGSVDEDTWYTVQQVADILQRDYETTRRYIGAGELPASKAGGRWLIMDRDLVKFMRRRARIKQREHVRIP